MAEGKDEGKEGRAASGYRYWVRGSMAGAAPKAVPQRLTADEVRNGRDVEAAGRLGSKWNGAGTWEEKGVSSWAMRRVMELLRAVEPVEFEERRATVVEVTSCSGEASLVTVRQRKRAGYTFEIEMTYAVSGGGAVKDVEGKMKVPEACCGELDDLELDVTVSAAVVEDSAQRAKLKQTLTKLFLPNIRRKLEEFEAELKER